MTIRLLPLLAPLALAIALAGGCGGGDSCPTLPVEMQGLASQAASIDLAIYDSTANCDGNDVADGAPAPVTERQVSGARATTLELPPGRYVVVLHAFDADGALIGIGCSVELFTPGQRACLDISLSAPTVGGRGTGSGDAGVGDGDGGVIIGADMAGTAPFAPQSSGTTKNLFQVWYAGGSELFVVGVGGTILHTTNGGASWQQQTSPTPQDLEAVWGSGPNDVYIVGVGGTVLHSANGGASWQKLTVPVNSMMGLWDVWGSGPSDVYITGDRGVVLHGNGTSFTAVNIGFITAPINDVWGSSANDVYLFGGNGLIMHGSAVGGFAKQTSNTTDVMLYGWGSADGNDAWINSKNSGNTINTIRHTGDHGATWATQLATATDIEALWSMASGHAFAVGTQILESTDHGTTWTSAGLAPAQLFGVGGDATGAMGVWTVGANGTILHRP